MFNPMMEMEGTTIVVSDHCDQPCFYYNNIDGEKTIHVAESVIYRKLYLDGIISGQTLTHFKSDFLHAMRHSEPEIVSGYRIYFREGI